MQRLFVPADLTWRAWQHPQRGGPLYLLGRPAFLAAEHGAFALGAARLALGAITTLAPGKRRGYTTVSPPAVAQREVFQHARGEAELHLRAARALLV